MSLRKGSLVEPTGLDAFPNAAGYTPYLVISVHHDGSVDLAMTDRPKKAVATRVPARNVKVIR